LVNWRAAVTSAAFVGVLSGQARPVQPPNAGFEFEAASLRPAAPVVGEFAAGPFGGPGTADPTRIPGINLTLKALLMRAYQVRYEQISGPAWIESARYDLLATIRSGATPEQVNEMLKNLLLERFKLGFHHEARIFPVYELVQTKNQKKRTKLREALAGANSPGANAPRPSDNKGFPEIPAERATGLWQDINLAGRVRVTGRNQPISELIRAIGNQARPVVDKTPLTGRYDFVLEYAEVAGAIGMMGMPMPARPPIAPAPVDAETDPPPLLITAIEEQLGLKLKPAKGALDVIVIDQAQRVPVQD
jgi:uncharacterized protein (TIGR03435 family)